MANPRGQQRDKPFLAALRLEIAAAQDEEDPRSIRRVARKLIDKAGEGDVQAIKELADRLDGKVPQALIGDNDADPINILQRIERVIVDPSNPDSSGILPAT